MKLKIGTGPNECLHPKKILASGYDLVRFFNLSAARSIALWRDKKFFYTKHCPKFLRCLCQQVAINKAKGHNERKDHSLSVYTYVITNFVMKLLGPN